MPLYLIHTLLPYLPYTTPLELNVVTIVADTVFLMVLVGLKVAVVAR